MADASNCWTTSSSELHLTWSEGNDSPDLVTFAVVASWSPLVQFAWPKSIKGENIVNSTLPLPWHICPHRLLVYLR